MQLVEKLAKEPKFEGSNLAASYAVTQSVIMPSDASLNVIMLNVFILIVIMLILGKNIDLKTAQTYKLHSHQSFN